MQTRPQLLETVWEAQPDIQTRTVDMHVQRLRTKLGDAGELIETVRGFGYRFRATEGGAARGDASPDVWSPDRSRPAVRPSSCWSGAPSARSGAIWKPTSLVRFVREARLVREAAPAGFGGMAGAQSGASARRNGYPRRAASTATGQV